ncbi:MAG: alkaline phosphatase family protein [Candidatus Sumerlaeaceae bacterium]|nr:alkaline phosphatase family protein [Candidatus Sumerlaeaceae bacterium]
MSNRGDTKGQWGWLRLHARWLRTWLSRARRQFNVRYARGPALLRRMGIPFSPVDPSHRGLLIIQIDGLSYNRLLKAVRRFQLPYIRRLLRKGRLRAHRFHSEIPTSTPAFQGGLFYGSNDEIPGFQFYDKKRHRYYKMGFTECAFEVEREFTSPGLLRDGSIFSGIFSGGAEARLFVSSSLLAPSRWRFALRTWDVLLLTLTHLTVLLKILLLGAVELVLAVVDVLAFVLARRVLRRQLEFIGGRLALSVITRELITANAVIDLHRRVPCIYMNYLGYDEHAHMRGPDSAVAYWTLRGIDRCIRRVVTAARYSEREYDIYILSDHGQEAVIPFDALTGESLAEFIQRETAGLLVESYSALEQKTAQLLRSAEGIRQLSRWLPWPLRGPVRAYAAYLLRRIERAPETQDLESYLDIVVASSGPIAYVYWALVPEPLTAEDIEERHPGLVEKLAAHPGVGFVSMRTREGDVEVRARSGRCLIRADGCDATGTLPFDGSRDRDLVLRGVRRITLMRRAGDLCVWGGKAPAGSVSYSYEFGGHSGWTDEEVGAFILAPPHIDFDFGQIRRHGDFYTFFMRYRKGWEEPIRGGDSAGDQAEAVS